MKITSSGPPGSGKSTLSKMLSAKLGMELVSMGDIFRKLANDRCMSLDEFGKLMRKIRKIKKVLKNLK